MKKRIISCLVCLLLFATISSVAGARDTVGEKGNERSFTLIPSTFTFYGHW
jgi:competence protein ComGC